LLDDAAHRVGVGEQQQPATAARAGARDDVGPPGLDLLDGRFEPVLPQPGRDEACDPGLARTIRIESRVDGLDRDQVREQLL
jgi:hypothetical protein